MKHLLTLIQNHMNDMLGTASVASVTLALTAELNVYLQTLALIVAITSGGIVIYKHFVTWRKGKKYGDHSTK